MIYAFDFEVFSNDWLVVFKNDQSMVVFHNDQYGLKKGSKENRPILVGFNNHNYDDKILHKLLCSYYSLPPDIYKVSNSIIKNQERIWAKLPILTLDTRQELPKDISLKRLEAHLGMNIVECSISFDIDRKLTDEELAEVTKYCIHDVDATYKIWKLREEYFSGKMNLVNEFDLGYMDIRRSQAGLSALVLDADYDYKPPRDRFCFDYDPNIDWSYIPPNLKWFFQKLERDYLLGCKIKDIEDSCICLPFNGVKHTIGLGGIHAAIPNYKAEENLLHIDVGSYYPALMINNNWISRACKDPGKFKQIRDTRFALKKAGDSREGVYKIILNSTYGATNAKSKKDENLKLNALFDPKMANNICVNGQLILIQLIRELEDYCKLIQSNTDGLIIEPYDLDRVNRVIDEFGKRFNLTFSKTKIKKIVQRDVNNYAIQTEDGKIKAKGIFGLKNWTNNFLNIVPKALQNYFFHGISVAETLKTADILDFQMIAKKGGSYEYVELNGERLQHCNRVFATKTGGIVYKVKANGRKDKVAGTSEKSTVWNEPKFDKIDLDTTYYTKLIESELQNFQ
jgi:DNA polymerase